MKSDIQIRNSADVCYIDIEGTIGVPEQWQFASPDDRVATYEKFRDAVARIAALDAEVTTRCYGYVASAATLISQAASEGRREISAGALYLVHAAACAAEGNAAELEARAELLRKTDERLAALYARRSGRPQEEFAQRMAENNGNGRWLAPEEAVAAGLADKVVEAAEQPASSLARNIARGWERLLANIGLRPGPALPADRNVLHFDGEVQALRSRSAVAADEARRQAAPTSTQPREDPSCGDTVRSANERAYAEDARRMRN